MSTAQEVWLTGCPSCGMNSCDCDEGTWNPPAQPAPMIRGDIRDGLVDDEPAHQHIEHCLWARNGNQPCPHVQPAQPQQEPVVFYRCNGCGHAYEQVHPTSCDCMEAGGFDRVEYYTYPQAQPAQQEPVAVPTTSYEHRKFVLVGRDWYERFAAFHDDCQIGEQLTWQEKTIRQQGYENGWNDAQRYLKEPQSTSPTPAQPSKPLTLGQKQRLWSSVGDKPTLKDRVNAYGTAIEAAHGIKGDA